LLETMGQDTPTRPVIIPVFLSYAECRHQCLFCNPKATAAGGPDPSSLRRFIDTSLQQIPSRHRDRETQVAFYGGSFTAMDPEDQISYLREVRPFLAAGRIDSIRISTRPDALSEEILPLLQEHGVRTVEIGVQSMIDDVLLLSNRGHSAADTVSAISRLKQRNFEVGIQLMIGLPGDTMDRFLHTLDLIIPLRPDFLRIHPTLVLRGAPLETLWRSGRYIPLSLDEAVEWLKRGLLASEKAAVPVARIGLQPTRELEDHFVAGPYHPSLNQLVRSALAFDMASQLLHLSEKQPHARFFCHPRETSTVRGLRNGNILRLRGQFRFKDIFIEAREDVPRECLVLQTSNGERSMHRRELYDHPH
jgi:histone acetyltransferase (RNA polymerase elongator complex component)